MERFEKLKSLGRGAQGTVILVRRKADKSKFVLKRVLMDDQSSEDRAGVMNEIKVLSMTAHPNVVGYFGSFMEDGVLNVVMEFADAGSLHQHIARAKSPFPEAQVTSYFAQLILALDHLHSMKVLHRDIKTKNVMMTRAGVVKLGDFGLSKVLGSQHSFASSAVGTPYYLSPELCEGKPYNHKSDVWALGIVAYELATFKHAFEAANLPALVLEIVQGEYPAIATENYSEELRGLIRWCLSKNPDDRPSAPELKGFPLVARECERITTGAAAWAVPDPTPPAPVIFDQGTVETALTRRPTGDRGRHAKLSSSDAGESGVNDAPQMDDILREVEEEEQFEQLIASMRSELEIEDRVIGRVPHFKCFKGCDLVDYLVSALGIATRTDAVTAAQRWMDAGVFFHTTRTELFHDTDADMYHFREDEVGAILNMRTVYDRVPPSPAELERDFRNLLTSMYEVHSSESERLFDYEGFAASELNARLQNDVANSLQMFDISALSFAQRIAFFINMFNCLVIHGIVTTGPPTNLYQRLYFYATTCYRVGDERYSLSDIEHGILRGNQRPHGAYRRAFRSGDKRIRQSVVVWDPRIHFALVRGSKTCPPLRVYHPDQLDDLLATAAREYCTRNVEVTSREGADGGTARVWRVVLPSLFEWYSDDFGSTDAQLLAWVAEHMPSAKREELRRAVDAEAFEIRYAPFDWGLNKKTRPNPPPAPSHGVPARSRSYGSGRGADVGASGAVPPAPSGAPPPPPPGAPPGGARPRVKGGGGNSGGGTPSNAFQAPPLPFGATPPPPPSAPRNG